MGKKSRLKKQQQLAEQQKQRARKAAPSPGLNTVDSAVRLWQALIVFGLSFLLYANTIGHDYTMDDKIVITENSLIQDKGWEGIGDILTTDAFYGFFGEGYKLVEGGRYRPLSIVTFAIEDEIFGPGKPGISHFINVLLYALCCLVIFLALERLFRGRAPTGIWLSVPFLAAVLYAAHPLHTEAVANIKGRDEIMGMLFAALTLWSAVKMVADKKLVWLLGVVGFYTLALLSKENPITFLAVVPIALYVFKKPNINLLLIFGGMMVVASVYLGLRSTFTGGFEGDPPTEVLNNPFYDPVNNVYYTWSDRVRTSFYSLLMYIKLLVVPHPLTHDYYYNQIPILTAFDWRALLGFFVAVGAGAYGLYAAIKRQPIGFAILFFFATWSIVSNLPFTVGIVMNERFLFMPSLGFTLLLAILLVKAGNYLSKKQFTLQETAFSPTLAVMLGALVLAYSAKTITRNADWKDDLSIFYADSKTSTNSAKIYNSLSGELQVRAQRLPEGAKRDSMLADAEVASARALEIYPEYANAWLIMGNIRFLLHDDMQGAVKAYRNHLAFKPGSFDGFYNLGKVYVKYEKPRQAVNYLKKALEQRELLEIKYLIGNGYTDLGMADSAIYYYQDVLADNPNQHLALYRIGLVHGKVRNDLPKSIEWLKKATQAAPNEVTYHEDLGVAYGLARELEKAVEQFTRVTELNPNYAKAYYNLGLTYQQLGNEVKAMENFRKAQELGMQMPQ